MKPLHIIPFGQEQGVPKKAAEHVSSFVSILF